MNQRVMAMKKNSVLPRAPELVDHHQIQFIVNTQVTP